MKTYKTVIEKMDDIEGIKRSDMKTIVDIYYDAIRKKIESGDFPNVYLWKFGTFMFIKSKKQKAINTIKFCKYQPTDKKVEKRRLENLDKLEKLWDKINSEKQKRRYERKKNME